MPLGKELETAVMVTVWVCTKGGCGWEHSPMSGGSTRPSAPHSNQLVSHHALPRKACFQQKQTFTRLVLCFLEAWESPSHLLTHHQLDEKGGGGTEHYGGHKWVGKKMILTPGFQPKERKKREMQVYQQHIPIVVRLAHHCATPLQQPDVHLCMMSMKTQNLLPTLQIWNGAAKAWASAAALKSHRGQAETESASLRGRSQRLPGSSVWPLDHRSWNRKLGKILSSSQSSPTLGDATLPPSAYHLKPDCRGQGGEAAAPSPLLRRAPETFPNLRPLPDHVTLPRQRRLFRGTQHYQADSGGSRCDMVSLKCPNSSWFPRV